MKCVNCEQIFDPKKNRLLHNPFLDIVSFSPKRIVRGQYNLWRWGYIENTFNKVMCPICGAVQESDELRMLWIFKTAKQYRIFQLAVLVSFLTFLVFADIL